MSFFLNPGTNLLKIFILHFSPPKGLQELRKSTMELTICWNKTNEQSSAICWAGPRFNRPAHLKLQGMSHKLRAKSSLACVYGCPYRHTHTHQKLSSRCYSWQQCFSQSRVARSLLRPLLPQKAGLVG